MGAEGRCALQRFLDEGDELDFISFLIFQNDFLALRRVLFKQKEVERGRVSKRLTNRIYLATVD